MTSVYDRIIEKIVAERGAPLPSMADVAGTAARWQLRNG